MMRLVLLITALILHPLSGRVGAEERGSGEGNRANHSSPITGLRIASDGSTVIDCSQAGIRIRNWADLSIRRTIAPPFSQIHDIMLSANESELFAVGGEPGESGSVICWSCPEGNIRWKRQISDDVSYALDASADGETIAVAAHDHNVYLLSARDGAARTVLSGHSRPVTSVAFIGENTLISGSLDHSIRVWNPTTGKIVRSLTNHTQPVTGLAVRPDSGTGLPMVVSCGEDKTVRLWQPTIGRLVRFCRLSVPVNAVTFDRSGTAVIAGCRDGRIYSVRIDTLETRTFETRSNSWINCIAAHPQEDAAVAGMSGGTVKKLQLSSR